MSRGLLIGLGVVVALVVAGSVFLFTPFRGELKDAECTTVAAGGFTGPTQSATVATSAVLRSSSFTAGVLRVGKAQGKDAVVISSAAAGGECLLVAGRVYTIGGGQVRLDSIQPTTPWADLSGRAHDLATFTVSA